MRRSSVPLLVALVLAAMAPAATARPGPGRIRFTAPPGESLLVHGTYPPTQSSCVDPTQPLLHARYRGTIEVVRASDGTLTLIGELAFEDYLRGIAEVPRDWPMEALKAQVVAARTYALNRLRAGSGSSEYDLCATTECQVYVGMKVEAGAWGERWIEAVDTTAGQVLLYEGAPASTYYSSTSPGRTFDNEDVFGGEPLPYLRGGPEQDDHASPVSRWRVEMPFADLARFLSAAGLWGGGAIRSVRAGAGQIRITGGGSATLSKDDLQDALNSTAACMEPDRYPTPSRAGRPLPSTVPSDWYRASQEGDAIVLQGRGWGHGVGMVQWGAYGKAERGLGYADILAAYYGGLRPQPASVPGTIRVLVADDLTRLTIVPTGATTVEPGGGPEPPWVIDSGARLRLTKGSAPAPAFEATGLSGPPRGAAAVAYPASLTLSDEANVRLDLLRRGEVAAATETRPFDEGTIRLDLPLPAVPPGRYEARAVASDGVDEVVTGAIPLRVGPAAEATSPAPAVTEAPPTAVAAPAQDETGSSAPIVVGGVAAILALTALFLVLTLRRRKGLHRTS